LTNRRASAASAIDGGDDSYQPLVNNFQNFIYNSAELKEPPKSFDDLLGPKFKGKIQYSTPGQAGDGTAVMLQVIHAFGSKDAAFDYLKKLQDNNVGPSASTGKLTALVNKGELYVANGDLQMNMSQMTDNPNIKVFLPTGIIRRTAAARSDRPGARGAPARAAARRALIGARRANPAIHGRGDRPPSC
jgi:2-aminoethylphosphonate transport system substrate-binding protein